MESVIFQYSFAYDNFFLVISCIGLGCLNPQII